MTTLRNGILGLACAVALTGCGSASPDDRALAFARSIARQAEADQVDARITSVSVLVHPGRVARSESNVGRACSSGRLVDVKLIGDFPHIDTTGYPVKPGQHPDFTVHAVIITADARTGKVCLRGVQTGTITP